MKVALYPKSLREWGKAGLRIVLVLAVLAGLVLGMVAWFSVMPGTSWDGPLPDLTADEQSILAGVETHVRVLAVEIGERNISTHEALEQAASYIAGTFRDLGLTVSFQEFEVDGKVVRNVEAVLPGTLAPDEIIVIGAHYDTFWDTPGADDNASAVAGMLELARIFSGRPGARTLRFVAFVNEEPPYFQNEGMGSLRYAKRCSERDENIVAMVCLEMLGFYDDTDESQAYPPPMELFYPSRGDFIGFVGDLSSRSLVRRTIRVFREHATLPSEGLTGPTYINGVDFSDHWSFWQYGYPAVMVTDTAVFRNPNYHKPTDTPGTLDFDRLARVVSGLVPVLDDLAAIEPD